MNSPAPLLRQLGVVSATAIVVSNMVGTGIFTASGFLAGDLGSPSWFFGIWAVGAIVALAGAFCYSELGVNFPSSGGEYVYLTQAYGPVWGFMTGWASLFAGFSAPIAAAALAFSGYLGYFFPALKEPGTTLGPEWFTIRVGGAQMVAALLIGGLTLLNVFGALRAARFQNVLTGAKLTVLIVFILLGVAAGTGDWSNLTQSTERTSTTPIFAQFAISLCFIYMSYSGWNAATYIAEELKQPARTLPLALTIGTLLVAALFLALNVVFVYAAPLGEMKGVLAIGSLAASKLFGPSVAGIFSAAMALSLVPTVNAMVTVGPRVYYAMAKNGAFLRLAASVDERWHTPVPAILLQGAISILMTLTPFPALLTFIGMTLNFFAVMTVASLFGFRKREGWTKLGVVSFAWPLMPLIFMAVGFWMTIYGFILEPKVSIAAVGLMALGAAIYHSRLRNHPPQPLGAQA
ncbi:MAG: amino acid permease [Bryobacteraceae bacterium]|nr:amino acid permease [Bryobacteraceae bacterium]